METMIWPDIFDGCVKAFFTRKSIGADKVILSRVLSISTDDICMPVQKHTDVVWLLNEECTPATADAVLTQTAGITLPSKALKEDQKVEIDYFDPEEEELNEWRKALGQEVWDEEEE